MSRLFVPASLALLLIAGTYAFAAANAASEVEIRGLHLCCGNCVSIITSALEDIEGVSELAVDRGGGSATFKAADEKAIAAALKAVADDAGMYGTLLVNGKEVQFPNEAVKKGTEAVKFKFESVHLCCRACTNGVVRALENDETIGKIACDQNEWTVTVEAKGGKMLDVAAVQAAINKAGFFARAAKEDTPKPKQ